MKKEQKKQPKQLSKEQLKSVVGGVDNTTEAESGYRPPLKH